MTPPSPRSSSRAVRTLLGAAALVALLAGCSLAPPVPEPELSPPPETVEIEGGMTYREIDGEQLKADACLPVEPKTARPAMLLLHGGGFESGDRLAMRGLCERLAARGIAGVTIDYRLLPAHVYPAQLDDVRAALAWLRDPAQIETLGIDPQRIGVLGSSAGAIMAQELGVGIRGTTGEVKAVVSLSGASNLTPAARTLGSPGENEIAIVLAYLGCPSIQDCEVADEASPALAVSAATAPMLLVNGTAEIVPVEQGEAMLAALQGAGVTAQLEVVDGDGHGLSLLTGEVDEAIMTFLQAQL